MEGTKYQTIMFFFLIAMIVDVVGAFERFEFGERMNLNGATALAFHE
jgi:hypothetical protein